jgi:hypothetical protein
MSPAVEKLPSWISGGSYTETMLILAATSLTFRMVSLASRR